MFSFSYFGTSKVLEYRNLKNMLFMTDNKARGMSMYINK